MILVVTWNSNSRLDIARFIEVLRDIFKLNAITIKLNLEIHASTVEKQALICHGSHISCVVGWKAFKLKEGFCRFFRIVHIAF